MTVVLLNALGLILVNREDQKQFIFMLQGQQLSLHCLALGLDQFSAVSQGLVHTDLHHLAFLQCIVPGFYID